MLVNMSGSFICKSISNVANESFEVAVSNFVSLHLGLKVGTKSLIVNRKVVYGVFSGRVTANVFAACIVWSLKQCLPKC
jgi:hypothetical protein